MHPGQRFQLIQQRAYDIYLQRDPSFGTAEEDWWNAEREIEREEELASPERKEPTRWSTLLPYGKEEIESPA